MPQRDHGTYFIGHAFRRVVDPVFLLAGGGGLLCYLREIRLATVLIEGLDRSASGLGLPCRFA
jgi:hypothetical protein